MHTKIGAILGLAFSLAANSAAASEAPLFVSLGNDARPPIGWIEFCQDNREECAPTSGLVRDAMLSARTWKELSRINKLVNDRIIPLTDQEHYRVVERWAYPEDGYGDCEDYALLKRRLLIDAGWPSGVLLMTVVRDKRGEGHAVLTVKTDRGEFILDNQNPDILLWSETSYRYVKRQSQFDPSVWVSLGDTRPAVATAAAR
jgi:predicted transglutaminase-like cysteine proteinase